MVQRKHLWTALIDLTKPYKTIWKTKINNNTDLLCGKISRRCDCCESFSYNKLRCHAFSNKTVAISVILQIAMIAYLFEMYENIYFHEMALMHIDHNYYGCKFSGISTIYFEKLVLMFVCFQFCFCFCYCTKSICEHWIKFTIVLHSTMIHRSQRKQR